MNRPNFNELVTTLKGGSLKGVGFQPAKPGNFDEIRNQKVVNVWLAKMENFMPLRLSDIQPWNLLNPI
jgi:hypothetical protein